MSASSVTVTDEWRGEKLLEEILDGADWGLVYWGQQVVQQDKLTTPVQTGALRNSKRTAPPDYSQDDTAASRSGDLAEQTEDGVKAQVRDHALAVGSWSRYSYEVETGGGGQPARPSTMPAVDAANANLDEHIQRGLRRSGIIS